MGLRKQFEEMARMRMDDTIWRSMDRRNITIKVAVGAVTHFHVKGRIKAHLKHDGRSAVVFCTEPSRAENNVFDQIKVVLHDMGRADDEVFSITGRTSIAKKL